MVLEKQSFYCILNMFFSNAKVRDTYFSIAILTYGMLILVLHLLTLVSTKLSQKALHLLILALSKKSTSQLFF